MSAISGPGRWAIRLARRLRSPAPDAEADAHAPAAAYADSLLALGFDHAAYGRDYPVLGALTPRGFAEHYHSSGRFERLAVGFDTPLPDAQARVDGLALPEVDKDLLRLDLAAAALRQVDPSGGDRQRMAELLRPTLAHRPLLVIGDSHAMLYLTEDVLRSGRLLPAPFLCTGASARGLGNPASRAQAGPRIRAELARLAGEIGDGPVLLKFGQVDLEFVYDYRRVRQGQRQFDPQHAAEFARDSARRYVAFLRELAGATAARLIVTAALPPALNDEALRDGYMNAHIVELHAELGPEALRRELTSLEMPDWTVRTGLARTFNQALAAGCAEAGLSFYDDFTPLLGPDGVIAPELILWHGGADHHLCATSPAARRAAARVSADIAALGPRPDSSSSPPRRAGSER